MITKERIAELRKLCDRATPGPWRTIETEVHSTTWPICDVDDHDARYDDADLIAAARTALPELLDEIERLRGICADQEVALQAVMRGLVERETQAMAGPNYKRKEYP